METNRMEKHVSILGILYIIFSILGIMISMLVFWVLLGSGLASGDEEAIAILAIIGTAASGFILLLSIPGIIGGIWLMKWKPWARILVLILGFLNLIDIPFGTALGIYTIWVLMKDETIQLFRSGGVVPKG